MNGARFARAQELFALALELPPAARPAALAGHCADDPALAAEVLALLATAGDRGVLDVPVLQPPATTLLAAGTRLGDFTVRSVLGEGGMGVVYLAEQDQPRRQVALKVLRPGTGSAVVLRRFELEVEMLGRLQHPGIAQVYGAGTFAQGTPFFAMELVTGVPITTWAQQPALDLRTKVETFALVCDAVAHAHERGILHRDLKPQNILVGDDGRPKVLDFGIARPLDPGSAHETPQLTAAGTLLGTLHYMSPEQLGADRRGVDVRTDVYSLGVVFYELLAGKLPHDGRHASWTEWLQHLQNAAVPPLASIDRHLGGDLTVIAQRALAKDRERRYRSPAELADELRRWLVGAPIAARADSTFYVLRRQMAQRPGLVAVVVVLLLAAVGFVAYSDHQARVQKGLRDEAERGRAQSDIERARLLMDSGEPQLAESLLWRQHLRRPDDAALRWALAELYLTMPSVWLIATGIHGPHLAAAADGRRVVVAGKVKQTAADGRRLVDAEFAASVLLFEGDSPTPRRVMVPPGTYGRCVVMTRDGRWLVVGDLRGQLFLFDLDDPELRCQRSWTAHPGRIDWLGLDEAAQLVWSSAEDGPLNAWSLADGHLVRQLGDVPPRTALALRPDGRELALFGQPFGRLQVLELGPEPRRRDSKNALLGGSLAYSPDSTRLLLRDTSSVTLLDAASLEIVGRWAHAGRAEATCAWLADGSGFVLDGSTIEVCAAGSGDVLHRATPSTGALHAAVGTAQQLVTASDRAVRRWQPDRRPWTTFGSAVPGQCALAFANDGRSLLVASHDRVERFELARGIATAHWALPEPPQPDPMFRAGPYAVACTADDAQVFVSCTDGRVFRITVGAATAPQSMVPVGAVSAHPLALSPDGRTVVVGDHEHLLVLDAATGAPRLPPIPRGQPSAGIDFLAPGTFVAATNDEVTSFDLASGRPGASIRFGTKCMPFACSPSGQLATVELDGTLRRWPGIAAAELPPVELPAAVVMQLAYCDGGRYLVLVYRDGTVRLLDPERGDCLLRLHAPGPLQAVAVHPTLPLLAWLGQDQPPAVLDLRGLDRPLAGHRAYYAAALAAEPDGRR